MIEQSENLGELGAALAKAQSEIKSAAKDATNPHFKSRYADLPAIFEACKPALTSNGIAIVQLPMCDPDNGRVIVFTMLLHASGQWIRSAASAIPRDLSPQSVGSAISYLKRYGLAAMAGVVADDDDDGNAAQPLPSSQPTQQQPLQMEAKKPDDPQAHNVSQLATPKQITLIRSICTDIKRDVAAAVEYYFPACGLKVEELNRQAASYLIQELKKVQEKM